MLEEHRSGRRPLYREKGWKKEERRKAKEKKKKGWYKKLGGQDNDFPVFCPVTPGGRLANKWRTVLEEVRRSSDGRVRGYVAERSGVPLSALLYSSQPGEVDDCGKADCNPCRRGTTRRLSCRRVTRGGMVYSCSCVTCKEGDVESWYHGATKRCFYTRQKNHVTGQEAGRADNALHKHQTNTHEMQDPNMQFRAEKFFADPASRQIYEGVSINNSPSTPGYLMNSRAEYQQGEVARVVLVRGLGD